MYRGLPIVRLFFASRVIATFNEHRGGSWRAGFRYRTIEGDPERGEETFVVEKDASVGRVRVALRSFSAPGRLLTPLLLPLTRLIQRRAGQHALDHLAAIAAGVRSRPPRAALGTSPAPDFG